MDAVKFDVRDGADLQREIISKIYKGNDYRSKLRAKKSKEVWAMFYRMKNAGQIK